MEDIYTGDLLHVWEDEDMVFMSFPWVTINIPREDWGRLLADLKI